MMNILNRLPVILLLILSASGVVIGDFFGKKWSIDRRTTWYVIAFGGYLASSFFYLPTLLREGLITTSIVWSLLSIIGFLAVGLLVFHEQLTKWQALGVFFGIVALILLSLPSSNK